MDCTELFDPADCLLDEELDDIDLAVEDIMVDDGSDIDNIGNITDEVVDSIDYDIEDDLEDYSDEDYVDDYDDSDTIEYEIVDNSEEELYNDIAATVKDVEDEEDSEDYDIDIDDEDIDEDYYLDDDF